MAEIEKIIAETSGGKTSKAFKTDEGKMKTVPMYYKGEVLNIPENEVAEAEKMGLKRMTGGR